MKGLITNIDKYIVPACRLCWLAFFCGLLLPSTVVGKNSVADEIISLHVTDQPLGEVLEDISIAASCQFSVDESWEDYPISVSFNNQPLYKGLKLIFRNINNAVIYGADRTVRINIYDKISPSGKAIENSIKIKSSQEPIQQAQPFSEATAPQPEVEVSEANEAGPENMESPGEESGEETATEDTSTDLEPIEHENSPEEESNQPEETESDLDIPENPQ